MVYMLVVDWSQCLWSQGMGDSVCSENNIKYAHISNLCMISWKVNLAYAIADWWWGLQSGLVGKLNHTICDPLVLASVCMGSCSCWQRKTYCWSSLWEVVNKQALILSTEFW